MSAGVGAGAGSGAMQPLAPPHDPVERRERRPVELRGHAILPNGRTTAITVVDLSYDGCGIQIPDALKPGDIIRSRCSARA